MGRACRVAGVAGCLLASLFAGAQVGDGARKIVLPNPQLVQCRAMECSQLWRQDSGEGRMVYPSQVLTDIVDGEVVGLTAVYDKSVSTQELRSAIDALYPKWEMKLEPWMWRAGPEKLVVSLTDRGDGTKTVTYLKVAHRASDLVPSAHINSPHTDCDK